MEQAYFILDEINSDQPKPEFAGFWSRLIAKIVDAFIVIIAMVVLGYIFQEQRAGIVVLAFPFLYEAFFLSGKKGATPGKHAMGIKVIKSNGQKISFLRALLRFSAEFISGSILYIGFIMAAFDQKKQALHDKICDTYVVYG